MAVEKKPTPFHIIRHRGILYKAQLPDGTWVYKTPSIYVPEHDRTIMTAPYDDHFIYEIPKSVLDLYPGPAYRCTCGSAAGWSGPSGYILDASQQGFLFVCLQHANTGRHNGGGERWV